MLHGTFGIVVVRPSVTGVGLLWPVFELPEGWGRFNPNCFLNPPNTLKLGLCSGGSALYIGFISQFWSGSDS